MIVAVAYLNTGFDIINVPENPALLRSCAAQTITFPALDILNKRFLSSVRLKNEQPDIYKEQYIEQIDYIELKEEGSNLDGIFYYVQSYAYTSKDVISFSIVQDSILTAGGISCIKTIYAKRAHIAKSQDTFGAFDADDELLMPKEPLQIVHSGAIGSFKDNETGLLTVGEHSGQTGIFFQFMNAGDWSSESGQETVVCSTVGLAWADTPDSYMTYAGGMQTFGRWDSQSVDDTRWPKPADARGISVNMPKVCRNVQTLVEVPGSSQATNAIRYEGVEYNRLGYHIGTYYGTIEAVDILRAVGLEDSVIACYRLRRGEGYLYASTPGKLPDTINGESYIYSTNAWLSGGAWSGEGNTSTNSGRILSGSEAYDYDYLGDSIKNMRVLYGQFRKYILASPATGSSIEAKPEELTARRFTADYSQVGNTGKNGAPYICCFTDPRPTGRPYFNFLKFGQIPKTYGTNNPSVINMADGAIAGGQWPEVPIVFTGMSGEWTAKVGYNIDASYRDYLASPEKTYRDLVQGTTLAELQASDGAAASASALSNAAQSAIGGLTAGPAGAAIGAGMSMASSSVGYISGVMAADAVANERRMNAMLESAAGSYSGQMLLDAANNGNIAANRALERQYAAAYEKAKFNLSTAYSTPRIKFMSTDSMRDMTKNGVYYARYTPTKTDLTRMDNILQAFGYKVDMLMANPIGNRSNFVYIEGSVEKFQNNVRLKKDMMLDINNQLANGIRVWKVNPKNADVYNPG